MTTLPEEFSEVREWVICYTIPAEDGNGVWISMAHQASHAFFHPITHELPREALTAPIGLN